MTLHPAGLAAARLRLPQLGRVAPAMVVGLALAGSLWFGLIPAVVRLHAQHRLLGGTFDPRLVDVGMLALNAALFASFVTAHRLGPSRRPGSEEVGSDGGALPRGASHPDEESE